MSSLLSAAAVEITGIDTGLQRTLEAAGKKVDGFASKVAESGLGVGGLDRALASVGSRLGGVASSMATVGGAAGIAASALVGLGLEGLRVGVALEQGMQRVGAALGAPREQLAGLRTAARELSDTFAISQGDVVSLMEAVAKNGAGGAEGVRLLTEAALELSAATGADRGGLAAGLDQVSDAFGILPDRAREVAAALFAVSQGRVPIEDLLGVFAKLAPAAQSSHIAFETLAGAAAQLLDQGYAMKQVSSRLQELAEKGSEGRREIERLAGTLPPAAENLGKLQTAAQDAIPPIDQATTALHNFVGAMASTDTVGSFTQVVRDLTALLETGVPGAVARAQSSIAELGRGLDPKNPIVRFLGIGSLVAGDAAGALTREIGATPELLKGLTPAQLGQAKTFLDRFRTEIGATKGELGELAKAIAAVQGEIARRAATPTPPLATTTPKAALDPAAVKAAQEKAQGAAKAATTEIERFNTSLLKSVAAASDTVVDNLVEELRELKAEAAKVATETSGKGATVAIDSSALDRQIALLEKRIRLTREQEALETRAAQDRRAQADDSVAYLTTIGATLDEIETQTLPELQGIGAGMVTQDDVDRVESIAAALAGIQKSKAFALFTDDQKAALQTLLDQIERIRARTAPTESKVAAPNAAAEAAAAAEKATAHLRENARLIQSAVDGATQFAAALGLAGDQVDRLRALGSIGANAALFAKELANYQNGAKGADGKTPLSTLTTVAGAALPIVGGLATLLSPIFAKHQPDPAEVARQQEIARIEATLVETIRALNRTMGGIDLGATLANRRTAVDVAGAGLSGLFHENNPAGLTEEALRARGVSYADFRAEAKRLGVELPETVQEITAAMLHGVIDAANSVSVQFDDLAKGWDALGTSATDRMRELLDFLAQHVPGVVSDLAVQLKDSFDLTTQDGRDGAIALVREKLRAGLISPELGKEIIDGITAEGDEIAAAAQTAAAKIAKAFSDIADALNTIDLTRQIHGGDVDKTVIGQQLAAYAKGLPEAYQQAFTDALAGLDPATLDTAEGREHAKQLLRDYYDQVLLADGVLDESEKQIAETVLSWLGEIDELGTSIADEAERIRQKGNATIRDAASDASAFRHENTQTAFATHVAGEGTLSPEFAKLADGLDLKTADGLKEFNRRLDELGERILKGDKTLELGSLTWDEFTAAALEMESGASGAAQAIAWMAMVTDLLTQSLNEAAKEAARHDTDTTTAQLGVLQNDPLLGQFFKGANFATQEERDAVLKGLLDAYDHSTGSDHDKFGAGIDFVRGLPALASALGGGSLTPPGSEQNVARGFAQLSETTGSTLADFARSGLLEERAQTGHLAAIEALLASGASGPTAPPVPQIAGLLGTPRGGVDNSVRFEGPINLYFDRDTSPADAYAAGQSFMVGVRSAAPPGADAFTRARFFAGDRTVRGRRA